MALNLSILYRGPLASCNYDCGYCPFAKRVDSPTQLEEDRAALERFIDWVEGRPATDRIGVFFTPWGEALTRWWYRRAFVALSALPQVTKVAIQTNLSCKLDWLSDGDLSRVGLWCTYHPGEVTRDRFLAQCAVLDRLGVRYSVGVVGMKEHLEEAEALRRELNPATYLWINAYKRKADYYTHDELNRFTRIDSLFPFNNQRHPSLGKRCLAGESVISVEGDGVIRRCHFIDQPLGNLYADDVTSLLRPRTCTNQTCGCHIGYVHMPELGLHEKFGDGLLERVATSAARADQPALTAAGNDAHV